MSNVIPFSSRKQRQQAAGASIDEERAALAGNLIDLMDRVREATALAAALKGPSLQVEQTAQHLLDAATALEEAMDALTEGGEWVPF
jgi:inactivated superfamily I helicase